MNTPFDGDSTVLIYNSDDNNNDNDFLSPHQHSIDKDDRQFTFNKQREESKEELSPLPQGHYTPLLHADLDESFCDFEDFSPEPYNDQHSMEDYLQPLKMSRKFSFPIMGRKHSQEMMFEHRRESSESNYAIAADIDNVSNYNSCIDHSFKDARNMDLIREALAGTNSEAGQPKVENFAFRKMNATTAKNLKTEEEYLLEAKNFRMLQMDDDYRSPDAWKDGGFPLNDQEVINKYRKALKLIL